MNAKRLAIPSPTKLKMKNLFYTLSLLFFFCSFALSQDLLSVVPKETMMLYTFDGLRLHNRMDYELFWQTRMMQDFLYEIQRENGEKKGKIIQDYLMHPEKAGLNTKTKHYVYYYSENDTLTTYPKLVVGFVFGMQKGAAFSKFIKALQEKGKFAPQVKKAGDFYYLTEKNYNPYLLMWNDKMMLLEVGNNPFIGYGSDPKEFPGYVLKRAAALSAALKSGKVNPEIPRPNADVSMWLHHSNYFSGMTSLYGRYLSVKLDSILETEGSSSSTLDFEAGKMVFSTSGNYTGKVSEYYKGLYDRQPSPKLITSYKESELWAGGVFYMNPRYMRSMADSIYPTWRTPYTLEMARTFLPQTIAKDDSLKALQVLKDTLSAQRSEAWSNKYKQNYNEEYDYEDYTYAEDTAATYEYSEPVTEEVDEVVEVETEIDTLKTDEYQEPADSTMGYTQDYTQDYRDSEEPDTYDEGIDWEAKADSLDLEYNKADSLYRDFRDTLVLKKMKALNLDPIELADILSGDMFVAFTGFTKVKKTYTSYNYNDDFEKEEVTETKDDLKPIISVHILLRQPARAQFWLNQLVNAGELSASDNVYQLIVDKDTTYFNILDSTLVFSTERASVLPRAMTLEYIPLSPEMTKVLSSNAGMFVDYDRILNAISEHTQEPKDKAMALAQSKYIKDMRFTNALLPKGIMESDGLITTGAISKSALMDFFLLANEIYTLYARK
jgi:hypothetical protein